jgi:hypothetical protein
MKEKNKQDEVLADELAEARKFLKKKELENSALKKVLEFLEKERNTRKENQH